MRRSLLLLCAFVLGCPSGSGSSGAGGGGSSTSKYALKLIEAKGLWSLTAKTTSACNPTTTKSETVFAMPAKIHSSSSDLSYSPRTGTLIIDPYVQQTTGGIVGSETCGSTSKMCPFGGQSSYTSDTALNVSEPEPKIPANAPDDFAFVVFVQPQMPMTCDYRQYFEQTSERLPRRAVPLTVGQLKSGRVVLEGKGTTALHPVDPDPGETELPLEGALTWDFRFVFQSDTYDANAALPPEPKVGAMDSWDRCKRLDPYTAESIAAAQAAHASGATDVAISEGGCHRMLVAGTTTKIAHVTGTAYVFDETARTLSAQRTQNVTFSEEATPTTVTRHVDSAGDGKDDGLEVTTLNAAGDWEKSVLTDFNSMTQAIERRLTLTAVNATTVHAVYEEKSGGTLAVALEQDEPRIQHACFDKPRPPPPSDGGTVDCSGMKDVCKGDDLKLVQRRFGEATTQGNKCLDDNFNKFLQPGDTAMSLAARDKLVFVCDTSKCADFGSLDPNEIGGKHELTVNINALRNPSLQSVVSGRATMFHETLHVDKRFRHINRVDEYSPTDKITIADRTYACESLCFDPNATKCACLRCITPKDLEKPTKEQCDKCKDKAPCMNVSGPRRAGWATSISVGKVSVCERTGMVCDTQTECNSSCVTGQCRPFNASCDPMCN